MGWWVLGVVGGGGGGVGVIAVVGWWLRWRDRSCGVGMGMVAVGGLMAVVGWCGGCWWVWVVLVVG